MMTWLLVYSVSSLSLSTNTLTFKASYKYTMFENWEIFLNFSLNKLLTKEYDLLKMSNTFVFQVYLPVLQ